jgi:anti-anti-sigma factor
VKKVLNVPYAHTLLLSPPESPPEGERQISGRADFEACHLSATRVCVVVRGDVDATNREALGHFVQRHTGISRQLVLDLSGVDFFGAQGFTALYYIAVQCARRDVDWLIVANRMVRRIVDICDTASELPVIGSLDAALDRLDHLFNSRTMAAASS